MFRTEEVVSRALVSVKNDRYKLSVLVFSRVKELIAGAKPLVNYPDEFLKKMELCDIALLEIAEGKVSLSNLS